MLESARERVALLKAGIDGKTIEYLYIKLNNFKIVECNPRKLNCWEFAGCGKEIGGKNTQKSGVCKASLNASMDGVNGGINGGRMCWAVSGTFCGTKIEGRFAKKLLSCRSCDFLNRVRTEEGSKFTFFKNNINGSVAEMACSI